MIPVTACGVCGATAAESLCTATPPDAPERTYAVVRCTACGVARTEPPPPAAAPTVIDTIGDVTRLVQPTLFWNP